MKMLITRNKDGQIERMPLTDVALCLVAIKTGEAPETYSIRTGLLEDTGMGDEIGVHAMIAMIMHLSPGKKAHALVNAAYRALAQDRAVIRPAGDDDHPRFTPGEGGQT